MLKHRDKTKYDLHEMKLRPIINSIGDPWGGFLRNLTCTLSNYCNKKKIHMLANHIKLELSLAGVLKRT